MARIVTNNKGFRVIEICDFEMVSALSSLTLCDSCINSVENGFYIAAMNVWYCEGCYQEWLRSAIRYDEDKNIEERNFKRMITVLEFNLMEIKGKENV